MSFLQTRSPVSGKGTGPRPTIKGRRPWPVARGPVPRDRSTRAKTARRPRPFPGPIEARRGTGPRPTRKEGGLDNRSAGACPPRSHDPRENRTPTKAIPRADRGTARDRPSPYEEGRPPPQPWRGGPRMPHAHPRGFPPRSLGNPEHGEGQALALR